MFSFQNVLFLYQHPQPVPKFVVCPSWCTDTLHEVLWHGQCVTLWYSMCITTRWRMQWSHAVCWACSVSPTGALRSRSDLVQLHRFWYGGGFKAGIWTMLNKHRVACRGFRHWAYAGERLFLLPVSKWQGILQFVLHKGDFTESFRNG